MYQKLGNHKCLLYIPLLEFNFNFTLSHVDGPILEHFSLKGIWIS